MISYPISRNDLESLIEDERPGWLARARAKTEAFKNLGKYSEAKSIWSEVKPLYMTLQGEAKCAYCERKLEGVELGTSEQDVEHFRPKKKVSTWGGTQKLRKAGVNITAIPRGATGYHLLPYDVFNYAASCKPCNSALKRDYFPITGKYKFKATKPEKIAGEHPLLIYPIGDFDCKAEELIKFVGLSPMAAAKRGFNRHRAITTIEFFRLDDWNKRKNLFRERAEVIVGLFPPLENLAQNSGDQNIARALVKVYTSAKSKHTNCARSFVSLYQDDYQTAKEVYEQSVTFLESTS